MVKATCDCQLLLGNWFKVLCFCIFRLCRYRRIFSYNLLYIFNFSLSFFIDLQSFSPSPYISPDSSLTYKMLMGLLFIRLIF